MDRWTLGDVIKLVVIVAIVLPLIGGWLLRRPGRASQAAGRLLAGLGTAAIIGALILAVMVGIFWLAYQTANP